MGNRFLPCLFNELVDFVEIEQAWSHIAWGDKEARAKYDPPFWASGWFRWRAWRSPHAGLDHLDWAMKLTMGSDWGVEKTSPDFGKPTSQAERAKEIKELYIWWTVTYRTRPDPYDASGWTEYCEVSRIANDGKLMFSDNRSPELQAMSDKAIMLLEEIEAAYEQEDTIMMKRLIDCRQSLWT